ncbi:MAG TPA: RDD family protein [Candidatus Koribacter sp.]
MTEPDLHFDPEANETWKSEVASRLDSYRAKNKRKLTGEFSMRFNFEGEPVGPRQQICAPNSTSEEAAEEVASDEMRQRTIETGSQMTQEAVEADQNVPRVELSPPTRPPLRPSVPFKRKIVMEANVIEFPRLFPPEPPTSYTVAEPVLPTAPPRILDAPEIAEPLLETPILDGMRLESMAQDPAPAFELPLQVAPVRQRIYASAYDGVIVLLGTAIFVSVANKTVPGVDWIKPMLGMAAIAAALFWAFYQFLFIVYAARTPGMAMTHLAFSTFQGTAPNRRERRRRLWGMAVSCSSLMLGFFWAFFDEDMLCWHDRISRTYIFQDKS